MGSNKGPWRRINTHEGAGEGGHGGWRWISYGRGGDYKPDGECVEEPHQQEEEDGDDENEEDEDEKQKQ